MLYNSQDMLWRRKLEEQADLQHAIELQNRRLMNLQLLDVKRGNHHRALSTGAAISSPISSPNFLHQSVVISSSNRSSPEFPEGTIFRSPIYSFLGFEKLYIFRSQKIDKSHRKILMKIVMFFNAENGVSLLANNAPVSYNQQAGNVSEKERDLSSPRDQNSNSKASPHHDEVHDSQERYQTFISSKLVARLI